MVVVMVVLVVVVIVMGGMECNDQNAVGWE
jgi:hypothetical protein